MKSLTYSTTINKSKDFVFDKLTDKSVYPQWAKAWGDGMTYEGEWKKGEYMRYGKESHHREHRVYMFIKNSVHSLSSVKRKGFPLKIMRGKCNEI